MKSNINRENDQPIASNSTQTKSPDNGIKQYDWDCKIKIQLIRELFYYCNKIWINSKN